MSGCAECRRLRLRLEEALRQQAHLQAQLRDLRAIQARIQQLGVDGELPRAH